MKEPAGFSLLRTPKSIEDLVSESPIYRKKPYLKDFLDYWEGIMILHHLEQLREKGAVKKNDRWFLP